MERRLAAILAADVVGYTRLMHADEAGTLERLKSLRVGVLEPLISRHGGRIVKLMGDGILVEFASLIAAVQCAVAWQGAVSEHEAGQPEGRRFSFRIGVELGDVMVDGDDIYGEGVNIATRLEQLADPAGICLSGDAYRQVRGKIDAEFEDLGEQRMKNIAEPFRVYRIASQRPRRPPLAGPEAPAPASEKPAIAVLPLANLSGDPEQEYFADGVTEDLTTCLSRFRELVVIGRSSSFHFKGTADEADKIAGKLGVQYLVEGSVRRAGDRLRLTVQLVEAPTGIHLWDERYDREIDDLFQLQDDIVQSIAQTLVGRVKSASARLALRKPPQNLAAYDYVLRARATIADNREQLLRSRALYEEAIRLDPDCSQAYAGLAGTYGFEWTSGWSDSPEDTLDRGVAYARKAAALDELDSDAQRRLGVFHLFRGDREKAEAHLTRALALNPNDADVMAYRALQLIYVGRTQDALGELDRATRHNPFHPTYYFWFIGLAHYVARDYQEAVAPLRKAIDAYPNFVTPHRHLAACYARLDQQEAAEQECRKILALEPGFSIAKIKRTLSGAYLHRSDLDHYCDGLRKAGLPE